MAHTIKDYLKEQHYTRKFRPITGQEYTLVFGQAEIVELTGPDGKKVTAVTMLVREKDNAEVFSFTTRSMGLLDQLADIERGDVFTLKKISKAFGGRVTVGYEAAIIERSNKA